jgi:hypothetical protein
MISTAVHVISSQRTATGIVRAVIILACQYRKNSTDTRSRGCACLAWSGSGGRTTGQTALHTLWKFRVFPVACSRRGQCANTVSMGSINSSFFTKSLTCAYIAVAVDIISWSVDSAWLYCVLPTDLIYLLVVVPDIKLLSLCEKLIRYLKTKYKNWSSLPHDQ